MTNEELAVLIQAGEKERTGQLWEQMERLIYWHCNRYFTLYGERCARAGVTLDDITQEGYLALLDAVEAYDPSSGFKLSSYLKYPLLNRVKSLLGIVKPAPLNDASSINEEVGEDSTLEDMLEDKTARDAMNGVIDNIWNEQLHATLETCLESIDPEQAAAVRGRFYSDPPQRGNSTMVEKGIKGIRRCRGLLKPYEVDIISRYAYNSGIGLWRESGYSSTEYTAQKLIAKQRRRY